MSVEENLKRAGYTLAKAPEALFNYVPYTKTGNLVFVAGQVPIGGMQDFKGKLGADMSLEDGQAAAVQCALNLLAQVKSAVSGDWSRVKACVKLGGFVNSTPDFIDQSLVLNAASDIMVLALGDAGRHARFAVSAPSLPAGYAVEIDAIFEIS